MLPRSVGLLEREVALGQGAGVAEKGAGLVPVLGVFKSSTSRSARAMTVAWRDGLAASGSGSLSRKVRATRGWSCQGAFVRVLEERKGRGLVEADDRPGAKAAGLEPVGPGQDLGEELGRDGSGPSSRRRRGRAGPRRRGDLGWSQSG